MHGPRHSALVLAGGRSRRFGDRDKAFVPVEGTPMVRRVADRLAPATDELVVNCRDDQAADVRAALADAPRNPRLAVDPVSDRGPLYGLRTGLRVAAGRYAVVAACDMPFVAPALLAHLCDRVQDAGVTAAVPEFDGRRQPLCAVYRVDPAREACETAIERGDRRLTNLLDILDAAVVGEPTVRDYADARALANVNTPGTLDRLTPDDGVPEDAPDATP